jgi:rod shape determining protein RodA
MSGFWNRLRLLPWSTIGILCLIGMIGILMLYSAGNGSFYPWANKQSLRLVFAFILMLIVAQSDIRRWLHYSYAIYFVAFLLLIVVEGVGLIGMGAQRWIDLYFFHLQPSEVMKIALVLALARFFHQIQTEDLSRFRTLLVPLMLVIAPVALVMKQPDLGTAIILFGLGVTLFFIAGVSIYYFIGGGVLLIAFIPIMWHFLHQYQRNRVLNFLNPEHDPLNTGYQILQSKIALGSGGLWGKGYLKGSQSHLNFLPAKQTDFIFTMLCEEWGMLGGIFLIVCYIFLVIYGLKVAAFNRNRFGRLVATGMVMTLFLYVFINMSMVMGLVPVVGVPLPFITYGGTSLLTLMIGFGLVFAVDQNRDRSGPRFLT